MKISKKFKIIKFMVIGMGAIWIPWGTFTGYCFGAGRYTEGFISTGLMMLAALGDGYLGWWLFEELIKGGK